MVNTEIEKVKTLLLTMDSWELKSLQSAVKDATSLTFSSSARTIFYHIDMACENRIKVLEQTPIKN